MHGGMAADRIAGGGAKRAAARALSDEWLCRATFPSRSERGISLDFLDDDERLPRQRFGVRWRGYWYVPDDGPMRASAGPVVTTLSLRKLRVMRTAGHFGQISGAADAGRVGGGGRGSGGRPTLHTL